MRHGSNEFSDITGLEPSYQIWTLVEIKGLILMQPNNWCCGQSYWIDFLIWTTGLMYTPMKLANCQVFLLCWTYKKTQQTKNKHTSRVRLDELISILKRRTCKHSPYRANHTLQFSDFSTEKYKTIWQILKTNILKIILNK